MYKIKHYAPFSFWKKQNITYFDFIISRGTGVASSAKLWFMDAWFVHASFVFELDSNSVISLFELSLKRSLKA
jgi:hypothetical protein